MHRGPAQLSMLPRNALWERGKRPFHHFPWDWPCWMTRSRHHAALVKKQLMGGRSEGDWSVEYLQEQQQRSPGPRQGKGVVRRPQHEVFDWDQ